MYFFEFIFWGRSFVILFKINLKIKKKKLKNEKEKYITNLEKKVKIAFWKKNFVLK